MKEKEYNLLEACEGVGEQFGLSDAKAQDLVEVVLENIKRKLASGGRVHLTGFAMFEVKLQNVRNPKTQQTKLKAKPKARFSKKFETLLNPA